jgi:hypothetical protein
MYPVSATFKDKIKELTRVFQVQIQIQHSGGVLTLGDADLAAGGLSFSDASQAGEDFTVGGKVASELSFEFFNKAAYDGLDFVGATVLASVGLVLNAGEVDGEGEPVEPVLEWVPLGVFNVDEVVRTKTSSTVSISAFDNMILLDKPYSLSQLVYPATLKQIYLDLCSVCDVLPGTTSFVNDSYVVASRPEGDLTCRDMLGYVAELSGTFARATRTGKIELTWYTPSGLTLTGANRYNFVPRDDVVQITGVMATVTGADGQSVTYLAGTDAYVVDLSENPLLQSNYETALAAVYNAVKNTSFHAFKSGWQGNPAIQAGDIITQVDRDGNEYPTLVTHSTYKYRGESTLEARGLPVTAKGFKGSTNKKIASIIRKVEAVVGDRLTSLEQATLAATELIANMLGGHVIQTEDALYIADNEDLDLAVKVWKWGIGGFGYSSTGKDGPYTTAITADGSIVAMLVSAGIVTADMVQAGVLQSQDGSTSINLNDGSFNFKDSLKWVDGELVISGLSGVVEENKDYGGVVISHKGLQVIDDEDTERVKLGRFEGLGPQTAQFVRNSTAYNPEDGSQVAVNEPRYVAGAFEGSQALLVEEGTTNIWAYSDPTIAQIPTKAGVTDAGGVGDRFSNGVYFGDNSVVRYAYRADALSPGTLYTLSCYVLMDDGEAPVVGTNNTSGDFCFILQAGISGYPVTVTPVGDDIYRVSVSFTSQSPIVSSRCGIAKYTGQSSRGFKVSGFQVEAKPYATTLMPTSGASATRSPEVATIPTAGVLSAEEGTWEQRVYVNEVARRQVAGQYPNVFYIRGADGGGGISVWHRPNSPHWTLETGNNPVESTSVSVPDSHTPDGWHLFRVTWKQGDKATLSIDGVELGVIDNPLLPSGFYQEAYVGQQASIHHLNTAHADIRLSSVARTDDSDLQAYQSNAPLPVDEWTTYLMRMDGNLQPTEGGVYGLLVRDKSGQKTILDENGILQTWQEGRADNVENGKPLVLNLFLPTETRQINKAILRFKRQAFRAYEKAAASGGGSTETTKSGGDHRHLMFNYLGTASGDKAWHAFQAGDSQGGAGTIIHVQSPGGLYQTYTKGASGTHTHDVTLPDHAHSLDFGIYESTGATKVTVKINGTDRTSALGGGTGFDVDKDDLDITPYMQAGQWNVIELGSATLGRIDATVFVQVLMGIS